MSLNDYLREDRPESLSRLTLFMVCITVILMVLATLAVYLITEGRVDGTNACALLSGVLLTAFVSNKMFNKGKESPTTNKE